MGATAKRNEQDPVSGEFEVDIEVVEEDPGEVMMSDQMDFAIRVWGKEYELPEDDDSECWLAIELEPPGVPEPVDDDVTVPIVRGGKLS